MFWERTKHTKLENELTIAKGNTIAKNVFLRGAYRKFYSYFENELGSLPKGTFLEIGAGEGFLKKIVPSIIASDIINTGYVELICSAESLPFCGDSLSAIFMCNVFHHIKKPRKFLKEATRVLKKNGKIVMIEPSHTPWGKWVRKNFHHESLLEDTSWEIAGNDPVLDANLANPWIIFKRDIEIVEKEFPHLKLLRYYSHTPFLYLLSGGANYQFLGLPGFTLPLFNALEWILAPLNEIMGMHCTIVITRL